MGAIRNGREGAGVAFKGRTNEMSILKRISLSKTMSNRDYKRFVEMTERQGIFTACGNVDDKWVMVRFEDELDESAWLVAMDLAKVEII